jgi:hypothetical protein
VEVKVRRFVYNTASSEIKEYLQDQGYQIQEYYSTTGEPVGFDVVGTTIRLGYQFVDGRYVQGATISMLNHPAVVEHEPETVGQSVRLYERLYRRFRKKRVTKHSS